MQLREDCAESRRKLGWGNGRCGWLQITTTKVYLCLTKCWSGQCFPTELGYCWTKENGQKSTLQLSSCGCYRVPQQAVPAQLIHIIIPSPTLLKPEMLICLYFFYTFISERLDMEPPKGHGEHFFPLALMIRLRAIAREHKIISGKRFHHHDPSRRWTIKYYTFYFFRWIN